MLASVIREIIAPVLRECPRDCGIVSITGVEVSADYAFVTVSISALKEPERALKFLMREQHRLQRFMGKNVAMRRTPTLRFRIDRSIERGDRLDRLLRGEEEVRPDDSSHPSQRQPL